MRNAHNSLSSQLSQNPRYASLPVLSHNPTVLQCYRPREVTPNVIIPCPCVFWMYANHQRQSLRHHFTICLRSSKVHKVFKNLLWKNAVHGLHNQYAGNNECNNKRVALNLVVTMGLNSDSKSCLQFSNKILRYEGTVHATAHNKYYFDNKIRFTRHW